MKVDLEDLVRDSLQEAAGSTPLDPHRWGPATPDRSARRLRIRVPHPIRTRAAAVLVAVVLIAGIGIPLALLSRLGGGSRPGGEAEGTVVSGSGLHLRIPEGWDGALLDPAGEGFGPAMMASNFVLPSVDHRDVYGPLSSLKGGQVILLVQEVTVEGLAPGAYPPLAGNVSVDPDDVRRFGPFPASVHSYARDEFSISGRQFNFLAGFGDAPSPSLMEDLNRVLATLEVEPADEPTGYRTGADLEDGLSISIPATWTFDDDPTRPIEPENVFAFGSWAFPSGGVCAPFAALDELPSDGAFVWMIEYHGTDHPEDFVPRPNRFDLKDFRFGETSCEGTPMYQLRFRDEGRFFQWQVAFGPQASEATEADTVLALDSLEVGGVCDVEGDGYAARVTPASGVAGTEATVSGEVPHGEPGPAFPEPPAPTTWIEVWWNLEPAINVGGWTSALPGGEEPVAARPGPVLRLGRIGVSGSCTYELTFSVPDTGPNTYPIVILHGDPRSAAAYLPLRFEVTG
jgi:hypothetical protein